MNTVTKLFFSSLFIFPLLVAYLFLAPKTVNAQGQFSCDWTGVECDASISTGFSCEPGFNVDEAFCDQFSDDESACYGATAACIQDTAPGNDGWQCVNAGTACAPCSTATNPSCMTDLNACNAACDPADPETTYTCVNNGCVPTECDPSQAGCYATAAMCQGTCRPPDDDDDAPVENEPFKLCAQIADETLRGKCEDCAGTEEDPQGIWTAIGCIRREPENIISALITIGLGMGGGVSLLMILGASFMLTTSQGDPKRTGEAKEMITASLIGLVFVIFSVAILQFIGVTILQIPGFGGV